MSEGDASIPERTRVARGFRVDPRQGSKGEAGVMVAIPAAGSGRRMGGTKKAFLLLAEEPLLLHALRPFLDHPRVTRVAVALSSEDAGDPPPWLVGLDSRVRVVEGGSTRSRSVHAALEALSLDEEVVLVQDAARPFVTHEIIDRCLAGVFAGEGTAAGWPVVDTLKRVDGQGVVLSTPERSGLWRAQTPQAFPGRSLLEAYERALREDWGATDDAGVFTRNGGRVRMVEGAPWNLKVTHPEDLALAHAVLSRREWEAAQ